MSAGLPPEAPAPGTLLCRTDDLADDRCKGLSFGAGKHRFEMFLVQKAGRIFAYVNECPHARTPLDWQPDQFLNRDKTLLLCGTHGAEFRIDDGLCVAGPCLGRRLTPVALDIGAGDIRIAG